jgi:tol-pal system protein YbgF
MRKWVMSGVLALFCTPVMAQDNSGTLADIRQQLTVLYGQIRALGQELNTTGAPTGAAAGGTALDRLNAIEAELQRLTRQTEEMQFRIDRIVQDGTNQIGDLEFRLCELEPNCDVSKLGDTPTLGGGQVSTNAALPPLEGTPTAPQPQTGPELAIGEQGDFERAREALADGDFRSAAEQFAAFGTAYPGSPLSTAAELGRGQALEGLGDVREAARAYLASFSADPQADTAPVALFHLGAALGQLGKPAEACVTLGEVGVRYPGSDVVVDAEQQMQALGCS